ncbi:PaaI family thioesterase [Kutzneria buriramensis]|uniref:PaaI family thioesterase n=1 Tax=Kutzneria buriramensis TaxID=1045776 RepID=UPI001FE940F1|nr:PaaI family thioesterase [Kutzneria buriramensis]
MNLDELIKLMPFATQLGITLDAASPEEARGRMTWAPQRCTAANIMHGGALMAFADTVAAVNAFLNLPPGATTSTIQSGTNFFRAVRSGTVTAVSQPLHVGRSTIVIRTDLHDDELRTVATITQTQSVLA